MRFAPLVLALLLTATAAMWLGGAFPSDRRLADQIARSTPDKAAPLVKQALQLDPANPYRWCDLAESYLAAGQNELAMKAFGRAENLGHHLPAVLMRSVNGRMRLGRLQETAPLCRRVLELVPDYDEVIFRYFTNGGMRPRQIFSEVLPEAHADSARAFLKYGIQQKLPVAELTEIAALMAKTYDKDSAAALANYLLAEKEPLAARQAWTLYLGAKAGEYPIVNVIYNSRFENEPAPTKLDWEIFENRAVTIRREQGQGVEVRFFGTENVDYSNLVQYIAVAPGPYTFRQEIEAEAITTNEGPYFHLMDAENGMRFSASGEMMLGTRKRQWVAKNIVIPPGTRLLKIQLLRRRSEKFDSKIAGKLRVYAVELRPRG